MKSILCILFPIIFCSYNIEEHKKIVETVNNLQTTWKAELSYFDVESNLGENLLPKDELKILPRKIFPENDNDELPETFDIRDNYKYCETMFEIRDQSKCSSCWAFASSEVMSDRICMKSKGKKQVRISAFDLMTCCPNCGYKCSGGLTTEAFNYWKNTGIVTGGLYGDKKSCKPYFLPECDDHLRKCGDHPELPSCEKKCQENYETDYENDKYFGESAYTVSGEKDIMKEVYQNGPVALNFIVYSDLADYKEGIYHHVTGFVCGAHAVKVLGWGVENGVKYWLLANSWNPRWGEKGYFRMLRGVNECGIETTGSAGIPKL